VVFSH